MAPSDVVYTVFVFDVFQSHVDIKSLDINISLIGSQEMSKLYLTETREICQHDEVELLFEGYKLDLEEIQVSIRTMLAQVTKILICTNSPSKNKLFHK